MNPKYLRYSIRSVILLTVVAALVANHYRPSKVQADIKQVKIDMVNKSLMLSLKNTSTKPLWFYGYGVDSPFYSYRYKTNQGEWETSGLGWCGTGAGYHKLKRNQQTEFSVYLYDFAPNAARPVEMQVGINFSHEQGGKDQVIVWSETIELPKTQLANQL